MTWSYRIIKHDADTQRLFAVHEVFNDEKGNITNWTEHPIDIVGGSKSDIKRQLKQTILDIETPALIKSELLK